MMLEISLLDNSRSNFWSASRLHWSQYFSKPDKHNQEEHTAATMMKFTLHGLETYGQLNKNRPV